MNIDRFSYPLSVNFTAFDPGFNSCESPKSSRNPSDGGPIPSQGRQHLTTLMNAFSLPAHSC